MKILFAHWTSPRQGPVGFRWVFQSSDIPFNLDAFERDFTRFGRPTDGCEIKDVVGGLAVIDKEWAAVWRWSNGGRDAIGRDGSLFLGCAFFRRGYSEGMDILSLLKSPLLEAQYVNSCSSKMSCYEWTEALAQTESSEPLPAQISKDIADCASVAKMAVTINGQSYKVHLKESVKEAGKPPVSDPPVVPPSSEAPIFEPAAKTATTPSTTSEPIKNCASNNNSSGEAKVPISLAMAVGVALLIAITSLVVSLHSLSVARGTSNPPESYKYRQFEERLNSIDARLKDYDTEFREMNSKLSEFEVKFKEFKSQKPDSIIHDDPEKTSPPAVASPENYGITPAKTEAESDKED